jgi:hypothetical protein
MLAEQDLCAERVPSKFGRSGPASSRPGIGGNARRRPRLPSVTVGAFHHSICRN